MTNPINSKKCSPLISQKIEWSRHEYLSSLTLSIDTNMSYLHETLTWSVTVLSAGIGIVLGRASFPDITGIMILLLLIIMMGHFAVRTGKAYMNVMRFSTLEKMVVKSYLNNDEEAQWEKNFKLIIAYHCEWQNPLAFTSVAKHVLFNLGFVYFLGISLSLVVYSILKIEFDKDELVEIFIFYFHYRINFYFGDMVWICKVRLLQGIVSI
jgi:hypothetical protein